MTAPGGDVIATAFVEVLPLVRNFVSALRRQLNSVTRQLGDLSGHLRTVDRNLNVVTQGFAFMAKTVTGLNTALPLTLLGMRALAAEAVVGGIIAAAAALQEMAGAALLLPAGLTAGAAAAGTLAVGLFGVDKAIDAFLQDKPAKFAAALEKLSRNARETLGVLNEFKPQLKAFKDAVQDALFVGLADVSRAFGRELLPRVQANFTGIARSINEAVREVARFALSAQSLKDIDVTSGNVVRAFQVLRPAAVNVASAFRDIAVVGSQFLPGIAAQFTVVTARVRQAVTEARQSGRLTELIANGLKVIERLIGAAFDFGVGIKAILDTAREAGLGLVDTIAKVASKFREFFTSTEGRTGLRNFLIDAKEAAQALAPVLGAVIGLLVQDVLPILTDFAKTVGPAVVTFIEGLGIAVRLAAPGIHDLAEGFSDFLRALAPALPAVGELVSALASLLAAVLRAVGPALAELIVVVSRALVPALESVTRFIQGLTTDQVKWIIGIGLVIAALGLLVTGLRGVVTVIALLTGAFATLFSPVTLIVAGITILAAALVTAWQRSETFRDVVRTVGRTLEIIIEQVRGLWQALQGPLRSAFDALVAVAPILGFALLAVLDVIAFLLQGVKGLIELFTAAPPVIQAIVIAIAAFAVGLVTAVPAIVSFTTALTGVQVVAGSGLLGRLIALRSFLLGPWGVALGLGALVLGAFAGGSSEAAAKQQQFASAAQEVNAKIREQNGVINENVRVVAARKLEEAGVLANAQKLGISVAQVTEAYLNQGGALEGTIKQLDAIIAKNTEFIASEGAPIESLNEQGRTAQALKDQLLGLSGARDADVQASQRQEEASGTLSQAAQDAANAYKNYADELDRVFQGLVKTGQVQLSVRDAERELEAAFDRASEAVAKNGATLDTTTEKGRNNQSALDGIASSALTLISQLRDTGASTEVLQGKMQTARDEFIKTAIQMGIDETAAGRLADQLGLIPGNYEAKVTVNPGNSAHVIETLRGNLVNLTGRSWIASVTVSTNVRGGGKLFEGLQHGGRFLRGQVALVGEAGPELVLFDSPGRVFSNPDSRDILSTVNRRTRLANREVAATAPTTSAPPPSAPPTEVVIPIQIGDEVVRTVRLVLGEHERRLARNLATGVGGAR